MKYVLHYGPEALHIQMEGRFTFADSRIFHRMLRSIAEKEARKEIRLDIANLEFIDATALSLLMQAHDVSKRIHCMLIFVEPKGQVHQALKQAAAFNAIRIAA